MCVVANGIVMMQWLDGVRRRWRESRRDLRRRRGSASAHDERKRSQRYGQFHEDYPDTEFDCSSTAQVGEIKPTTG